MLNETPLRALPDPPEDFAVTDRIEDCLAAAKGAISDNTERALRSDLGIYAASCGRRGLAAIPASPATVATFIDEMAAMRAPATVRRYVASIAAAHRAIGRGRSVRSAAVRHALQRMHRARGRRQEQAQGLTWPLRQRLLETSGTALIDGGTAPAGGGVRRNAAPLGVVRAATWLRECAPDTTKPVPPRVRLRQFCMSRPEVQPSSTGRCRSSRRCRSGGWSRRRPHGRGREVSRWASPCGSRRRGR